MNVIYTKAAKRFLNSLKSRLLLTTAGFLTTLDTRIAGSNRVKIEPCEKWEKMEYALTAGNADPLQFNLRMRANTHGVTFEKVSQCHAP
jgi:hypothetical protein